MNFETFRYIGIMFCLNVITNTLQGVIDGNFSVIAILITSFIWSLVIVYGFKFALYVLRELFY